MKYFFLGLFSLVLLNTGQAQEMYSKMIPNIKAASQQYADAYKEGNAQKLMDLAPLAYTQTMNEEQNKKAFDALTIDAKRLNMIKMGEPTKIQQVGTAMHALIPLFYAKLNPEGKKIEVNTHLLAISEDGGANWSLLNAETAQQSAIKALQTTIEVPKTSTKMVN